MQARWRFVALLAFTLTSLMAGVGESVGAQESLGSIIKNLGVKNPKERLSAKERIEKQRHEVVQALIGMVQKKEKYELFDSTALAIELLGSMRSKEAIDVLSESITIKFQIVEFEIRREEEYYLAAVALAEIGDPAIPVMIKNMTGSPDPKKRTLSTWVIAEILGKDIAQIVLKKALDSAQDDKSAERIKAALQYLENLR